MKARLLIAQWLCSMGLHKWGSPARDPLDGTAYQTCMRRWPETRAFCNEYKYPRGHVRGCVCFWKE